MAKILFVEDEVFLSESFIQALLDRGHKVDIATDGEEALSKLIKSGQSFDLVILDIMLPRGRSHDEVLIGANINTSEMGIEILRRLKDINIPAPIIMFTAVIDDEMHTKISGLGVNQILAKPVSLKFFLLSVEKALNS